MFSGIWHFASGSSTSNKKGIALLFIVIHNYDFHRHYAVLAIMEAIYLICISNPESNLCPLTFRPLGVVAGAHKTLS